MGAFSIRSATAEDVATVLRLIRALADYEKLAHEVVATEDSLQEALFSAKPDAECVIAREGERPVGFALFFNNFSTFRGRRGLYLEDLFVEPDCRGKGYGRALLAHLASLAIARSCARFEWSVLDWNAPAIGFYRSLGANVMDEWRICRLSGDALQQLAASAPR